MVHPTSGATLGSVEQVYIYPAVHDRLPEECIATAVEAEPPLVTRRLGCKNCLTTAPA